MWLQRERDINIFKSARDIIMASVVIFFIRSMKVLICFLQRFCLIKLNTHLSIFVNWDYIFVVEFSTTSYIFVMLKIHNFLKS